MNGSIECFKHCEKLNELYIYYPRLRENLREPILTFRSSRLNLNYRSVQRGKLSSRRTQHCYKIGYQLF